MYMEKFTQLSGIAAPLRMINVDTDIIIPKQFLRTIKRTGLGIHAFNDIRYNEDGSPKQDFILNKPEYNNASILITGENFGCVPIKLPKEQVEQLMQSAEQDPDGAITIDLEKQTITRGNVLSFEFEIDPSRKHSLLNGLDDIGLTEQKKLHIAEFEQKDNEKRSWLYK